MMTGRRRFRPAEKLALLACFVSVVRLLAVVGADDALDMALTTAASKEEFVSAVIAMETGERIPENYSPAAETSQASEPAAETAPEAEISPVVTLQPDDLEPVVEPKEVFSPVTPSPEPEFSAADAAAVEYTNETAYTPQTLELLNEPLNIDFSAEGPLVLIAHTHASESYVPEYEGQYELTDNYRSENMDYTVVKVGDALEEVLVEAGVAVLHDRTVSDYPSYTGSYTRTLAVIEDYLREYPSIQIVIDLHRDAGIDDEGIPTATYYDEGEQRLSQVMLVAGTDEGGLEHPNWRENLKMALRLQALTNRENPGLMRPINLRQERFNQHLTYGSLIVEVGFAGNTLAQAEGAVRVFGQSLTKLILRE